MSNLVRLAFIPLLVAIGFALSGTFTPDSV